MKPTAIKTDQNHSNQAANNIHNKIFENKEEVEENEEEGVANNRYTMSPPLPELISNEDELDSTRCLSHERLKPIARPSFDIGETTNNQRHHPYALNSHSRPSSSTSIYPTVTVKEEDNSRQFGYSRRIQKNTSPPEYYLSNYSMIKQRIPITSISPPPSSTPSTKYQGHDRMSSSSTIQSEYHRSVSSSPPRDQKPILSPRHTPFMPYRMLSTRPDSISPPRTTVNSHQKY